MFPRKLKINTLKGEVLATRLPLDHREARRRKGFLKIERGISEVAQWVKKPVTNADTLSLIPTTHRVKERMTPTDCLLASMAYVCLHGICAALPQIISKQT